VNDEFGTMLPGRCRCLFQGGTELNHELPSV